MANSESGKRVATTRPDNRRGVTKSQIREERRQRSATRKRRRRMVYMSGGSVLAIVFILSFTLGPGLISNRQTDSGGNINTGGPVAIDTDDGQAHVTVGSTNYTYSVKPATSGPHWQAPEAWTGPGGQVVSAPADWGTYDFPLPDQVLLHNLEHGGIGFHYDTEKCGDTCAELVDQFKGIAPRTQFIIAPYTGLETKIAITSWRHHLFLDEFDAAKVQEFIDEYLDRAPESVPFNQY
jgi:hypothetical protein